MENQSNETKLSCTAYVNGVRKRCRKIEKHRIELGNFPIDINPLEVEKLVRQALINNFKQVTSQTANVQLNFITLERNNGFLVTKMELFDARSKAFKLDLTKELNDSIVLSGY